MSEFPGVAVVTGAGGVGIGGHTARAFAEANCARIAITDLSDELLGETASALKEINPSCTIYAEAGDISSPDFVTGFFSNVKGKFGRIDYAVNCAGVLGPDRRSHELSLESFDLVNQVNYRGCWLSSRAELGIMVAQSVLSVDPEGQTAQPGPARAQQRGAIVNVASQLGIVGRSTAPAYCASKSAVIGMTRADAIDYSADGIRVNCVCPGVIQTAMTTGTTEVTERIAPAIKIAPMERMGLPEEVADAILFLCSRKASFVQGHAMVVDGGYIIR